MNISYSRIVKPKKKGGRGYTIISSSSGGGNTDDFLLKSANLSDLNNIASARNNLGLGALATKNTILWAEITDWDTSHSWSAKQTFQDLAIIGNIESKVNIVDSDNILNLHYEAATAGYLTGLKNAANHFSLGNLTGSNNDISLTNYLNADLIFKVNNQEKLRLKNSGNFGINESDAKELLHVKRADTGNIFRFEVASKAAIFGGIHANGYGYIESYDYTLGEYKSLKLGGATASGIFIDKSGDYGSENYSSGWSGSGWQLEDNAGVNTHLTVDHLTVRKRMNIHELHMNMISASNGGQIISDALKIDLVTDTFNDGTNDVRPVYTAENDLCTLKQDDIVLIQQTDYIRPENSIYFKGKIRGVGQSSVYPLRQYAEIIAIEDSDLNDLQVGQTVCRISNLTDVSRQGIMYLTASENNSPYLDILHGEGAQMGSTRLFGMRYIRIWMNGNTSNTSNHLIEVEVMTTGGVNRMLSLTDDKITVSGALGSNGVNPIKDGDTASNAIYTTFDTGEQWLNIDLGSYYTDIEKITLTPFYADVRTYHDVRIGIRELETDDFTIIYDARVTGDIQAGERSHVVYITPERLKVRLGNLAGITYNGAKLSGFGLFADNAFLRGSIIANAGLIAGWIITDDSIYKRASGFEVSIGIPKQWTSGWLGFQVGTDGNNRIFYGYDPNGGVNWGIWGRKDGNDIFQLGNINQIAGWNFTDKALSKSVGDWRTYIATDGQAISGTHTAGHPVINMFNISSYFMLNVGDIYKSSGKKGFAIFDNYNTNSKVFEVNDSGTAYLKGTIQAKQFILNMFTSDSSLTKTFESWDDYSGVVCPAGNITLADYSGYEVGEEFIFCNISTSISDYIHVKTGSINKMWSTTTQVRNVASDIKIRGGSEVKFRLVKTPLGTKRWMIIGTYDKDFTL